MSTDYNYDEQGQFFPYFILTILGLVLLPLSYSTLKPSKQPGHLKRPLIKDASYHPPRHERVEAARRRQAKKERRLKRFTAIILGWALFAYMAYLIVTTKTLEGKIWDPYEILGISMSADEKAIKSHYKKLSIKFHPDKIRPTANETLEMLNDHFVEITKAYKALTDEEIRNNYIQFGHPDGKQSFSIGIALPTWIVAEGNTYYVLAVYGLLLGILLPYMVGKWWYGTRRHTKDGVMTESAGKLFTAYEEDINERKLVEVLTVGEEMKEVTEKSDGSSDATVEKQILAAGLPQKDYKVLQGLDGWRRRALGLLWAYLYRVDFENDALEASKLEVAAAATALNKSFNAIALVNGNLQPLMASMQLNQHIIQATAPGQSPLLQLPYFSKKVIAAIQKDEKPHWTVQRLMSLSEERRKKMCTGNGLLSASEYATAMKFARSIPTLHVEQAFFKVMGEKYITPSSLVQFVLKMRVIPPGVTAPAVDPKKLSDEDPDETDVEALLGRNQSKNKENEASKPTVPPLAHSSFYPRDYQPSWYICLTDVRQGKMVVPPAAITTFSNETDNFAVVTSKMQFQAPPQPGEYRFTFMLVSDSYMGLDTKMPVTLVVSDPSKMEKIEEMDDISEPEEDSLAGQMNAMRGQGPAPTKRKQIKGKAVASTESSDEEEESDTDGEEVDVSETDTDTDTDEE